MFGQPMKVGLKTSNLPDDAIDDIFAEEELEKIISGQDGDEQNDPTEDPMVEENHLPDITDAEGSVLELQKKHVKKICHPQKWFSINMCSARERNN